MNATGPFRILVTGGTGSFGQKFVERALHDPAVERIVVYSRDELKQWNMQQLFPTHKYTQLRYFIGDVRDQERLRLALTGINTIVHAAALKQVPVAEYNPMEFIKTNIIGADNIIKASLGSDVKRVVALSTDKAASPVNLYGATKLCSDKLFIAANNITGSQVLTFSVVRYGNVFGSRGSVVPLFLKTLKEGYIPITDPRMTRFSITLDEGVSLVYDALRNQAGGDIIVPKLPTYNILDLAKAIGPDAQIKYVGIRPGEKIHEDLITNSDSLNTYESADYYSILPDPQVVSKYYAINCMSYKKVADNFFYRSDNPDNVLTRSQLSEMASHYNESI